jgi:hypothetical protein
MQSNICLQQMANAEVFIFAFYLMVATAEVCVSCKKRARRKMAINWNFPSPRPGLAGALDRFIGPGATRAELALQFGLPALAAIAAPLYASRVVESWSWLQYAVCCILAFDTAGGIITNATSSAKRWYHRTGRGFKQHFGMVSLHLLHLLLVSWLYLSFDIWWFAITGAYLLFSATIVLSVPQYLQRPVAVTVYACALLMSIYVLSQPTGLEWFLPLFYLKLLVSHLPKEEPYRPTSEANNALQPTTRRAGRR